MYGFNDDSSPQGGKSDFHFGLNQGVNLVKFEYNPNGGSGGTAGDCIDIEFKKGNSTIRKRMFPITKVYHDGAQITDPKDPNFQEELKSFNAWMTHILSKFVEKDDIKKAFITPIANFKQYAEICMALFPPGFESVPLDLFLQYEWQIKGDNKMTFFELPKNMKHGPWVSKAFALVKAVNSDDGLSFVSETGEVHPISRTKWFMDSNFAKPQKLESGFSTSTISSGSGTSATSEW